MMEPFRFSELPNRGNATEDQVARAVSYCRTLGLPFVEATPPHGRKLAVVGGAPSLPAVLDDLRAWDGDIWAINHTAAWLAERGVKATLLTVDPGPWPNGADKVVSGVDAALMATCCRETLFDAAIAAGVDIEVFHVYEAHVGDGEPMVNGGGTTACRAPFLALRMGYTDVSFFACESCFDGPSHAYKDTHDPKTWIKIKAGDQVFKTDLRMMLQAENLSIILRNFPDTFKDRSGGLLGAMIENIDTWGVVEVSDFIQGTLDRSPILDRLDAAREWAESQKEQVA